MSDRKSGEAQKRDGDAQDAGIGASRTRAAALAEGCGGSVPSLEGSVGASLPGAAPRTMGDDIGCIYCGRRVTVLCLNGAHGIAPVNSRGEPDPGVGAALEAGPQGSEDLRKAAFASGTQDELSKLNKLIGHLATCEFCHHGGDPRECTKSNLYRQWNNGELGSGEAGPSPRERAQLQPLRPGESRCGCCAGTGRLREPEPGEMVDI